MLGHQGKLAGNIARTDREIQMELKRPAKHNFSVRSVFVRTVDNLLSAGGNYWISVAKGVFSSRKATCARI